MQAAGGGFEPPFSIPEFYILLSYASIVSIQYDFEHNLMGLSSIISNISIVSLGVAPRLHQIIVVGKATLHQLPTD